VTASFIVATDDVSSEGLLTTTVDVWLSMLVGVTTSFTTASVELTLPALDPDTAL